jgi:hypothetical protein
MNLVAEVFGELPFARLEVGPLPDYSGWLTALILLLMVFKLRKQTPKLQTPSDNFWS